jgi:hypothetical protein
MSENATQRAITIKRKHEDELMGKANVVAVGVGLRTRRGQSTNEVCIVVSVTHKVPAAQLKHSDLVPNMLEGVPVDVLETGEIMAQ